MEKRFSEEQIIGYLREAENGVTLKDLCRRHGVLEPSFYPWRRKYGGMDISDAKRLRVLETGNARRKTLLVESLLENEVALEALGRQW